MKNITVKDLLRLMPYGDGAKVKVLFFTQNGLDHYTGYAGNTAAELLENLNAEQLNAGAVSIYGTRQGEYDDMLVIHANIDNRQEATK